MKNIYRVLSVMLVLLSWTACAPDITDDTAFELYYYNVSLTLGEDFVSQPSYIGERPDSFEIYAISCDGRVWYNPKLDGKLTAGTYKVSIRCVSGGVSYTYPDMVTVKINKAK